jgi:acetyl esterase/lipase
MEIERGIVYAEREGFRALELDVYRPDGPSGGRPLLVFVHGGGWRVGHRGRPPRETRPWEPGFFERLAAAGFVVAAPGYRLSAEAIFPAQRDDVVEALSWLAANPTALGTDGGPLRLWGASAGAHLVALAALAPPPGVTVAAAVCWYGIMDLAGMDRAATDSYEAQLLGGPIGARLDAAREASPVIHVHPGAPPFLLQHGDADRMVPCGQSERLAAALRAAGVPVELEVVPGADHFFDGAADVEAIFDRALAFLSAR